MTQSNAESTGSAAQLEQYQLVRSQIEHEDNLNSQRLSWFVAAQSFLFTAYAIVVSNLSSGRLPWVAHQMQLLILLIPMIAILTCTLIYVTILAGTIAILNLKRLYHRQGSHPTQHSLPPVQGFRLTQVFGQAGPLGLPPLFVGVWLVLIWQGMPA